MTITIVTPWWEHVDLLYDYIGAIARVASGDEIIVVDDGGCPEFLNVPAKIIRMPENVGFTRACNAGLEAAEGDAVLFLNNDIRATSDDWLEKIRAALEPGVLVGAQLRYDSHANVDGEKFPYLDGWCLAGMTADLRDLGGFDETLDEPAYYSDNLICLHARAQGMTLREAKVGLRHKLNVTVEGHPNRSEATMQNYQRYLNAARMLMSVPS